MSLQEAQLRRREPRFQKGLAVRIFGIDSEGHRFSQDAIAANVSTYGALLVNVQHRVSRGNLLRVSYEENGARFRIVWSGDSGSNTYRVAVQMLEGDQCPWKIVLTKGCEISRDTAVDCPTQAGEGRPEGPIVYQADQEKCRPTRRWTRHKLDVPIRVIVHDGSKTSLFDGRGNELSEGGMALMAGVELQIGDVVEIEFTPPYSGMPIRSTGTVRNRSGYRYGIEFLSTSELQLAQVHRLVAMLASMSG